MAHRKRLRSHAIAPASRSKSAPSPGATRVDLFRLGEVRAEILRFALNDTKKRTTQEKEPGAKWRPRHFAISTFHFSLGAGVTPAEGSLKPIAGFTFNLVDRSRRGRVSGTRTPSRRIFALARGVTPAASA